MRFPPKINRVGVRHCTVLDQNFNLKLAGFSMRMLINFGHATRKVFTGVRGILLAIGWSSSSCVQVCVSGMPELNCSTW